MVIRAGIPVSTPHLLVAMAFPHKVSSIEDPVDFKKKKGDFLSNKFRKCCVRNLILS